MKDFLFLFRGGEPSANLSPAQVQQRMQKWTTWIQDLSKAGKFKSGYPLENAAKVVSGKNRLVTDGPFAESKEGVGGYLIVAAGDLADAADVAKGCPIFEEGGAVEVRPIMPM
ncbi:MAG: YciI family protein [bacterium]